MVLDDWRFFKIRLKALGFETHMKESRHVLESAFLICRAVGAVNIVDREKKPKGADLKGPHLGCISLDNHAFSDRDRAGWDGLGHTLDLHKTQPARGMGLLLSSQMAKMGDVNSMVQAGIKQNRAVLDLHIFIVHNHSDHLRRSHLSFNPFSIENATAPRAS
jgi:hypothetical protein